MRRLSLSAGIFFIGLLGATSVQAGNESWVSGTGSDVGNCPRTAPCRTFQFAHDQTSNNGAINVLTAGNFGPVTITKPISIVADGVEAVINTAANGAAITVDAGDGAIISLRGLTIDLRGTNNIGINFFNGRALHVHNCAIRKGAEGIRFTPGGNSELYIADSAIADHTFNGLFVGPSGNTTAVLDRVRTENNGEIGMRFQGTAGITVDATLRDSVSAGNGTIGIVAVHFSASSTIKVMIEGSALLDNSTGVASDADGAVVRIGNSTVTGNNIGLRASGSGVIESYGTNKVDGNNTDVSGTPTPIDPK